MEKKGYTMAKHHKVLPRPAPEPDRRSDFGTFKTQERDWDGWELIGSMKWVRADTLGMFWDPAHRPAIIQPPHEKQQGATSETPNTRGGKRTGLPWPQEYTARMNATLRIVYRWEAHGFAKRWQPWAGQPQWVSLTEAALAERMLPWHEIGWPDRESIRHDDRYYISHIHRVNQMRVRLLGGAADAPMHLWKGERAIEATFPPKDAGALLPHLPDGALVLQEDGAWDIKIGSEIVDTVAMRTGQTVAIEVELSRKDFERLDRRILPSLLEHYDFIWYFCEEDARKAVYTARGQHLKKEEDQRRIRIMRLDDYL